MLSELAEQMTYVLDITNDEYGRRDFYELLEDGDVCEELIKNGFSQEDIDLVHNELVYQTAELSLDNGSTYDHIDELDDEQKERAVEFWNELVEFMGDRPREIAHDQAVGSPLVHVTKLEFLEMYLTNAIFDLVI